MGEMDFEDLRGRQLRYRDATWELTGDVDVRESGDRLAVEARRSDDVRHEAATLSFGVRDPPDSLNPGNVGVHFDRLEQEGDEYVLVVRTEGRTYRYELQRLAYE